MPSHITRKFELISQAVNGTSREMVVSNIADKTIHCSGVFTATYRIQTKTGDGDWLDYTGGVTPDFTAPGSLAIILISFELMRIKTIAFTSATAGDPRICVVGWDRTGAY